MGGVALLRETQDKLELEDHQGLAEWALKVDMGALLPSKHKSAGYECPMLAVVRRRHAECGGRLSVMTLEQFQKKSYGYLELTDPFVGHIYVPAAEGHLQVLSQEEA